jgi:hypothetical protein
MSGAKGFWRYERTLDGEQTRCSSDGGPCPDIPCSRPGRVGLASGPDGGDGVIENQIGKLNSEMNAHISELNGYAIHS